MAVAHDGEEVMQNNEQWLDIMRDDVWWPAIEKCDRLLNHVIPGYKILQIKEKFGGLRYYIEYPEGMVYDDAEAQIAQAIIDLAEREAMSLSGYYASIKYIKKEDMFKDGD